MVTRRRFLKVGFVTGAVLAGLGAWYRSGLGPEVGGRFALQPKEREIVAALVPVMLSGTGANGALHAAAVGRTVSGVEQTIAGLSASAQDEVRDLFALLSWAPARIVLTGLASDWREAGNAEVAAFLERWRFSRLALLRSAYAALHDLVLGAWYGAPDSWEAIGYPGPPEVA